jgi:DDE family transposase
MFLLEQVYEASELPWLADLPAIDMLRQVWVQNYYQEIGRVCLRAKPDQPPTARRIASPYDPEARYCTKREISWVGYKLHITETCDLDAPHLITQVETRPSTEPDNEPLDIIHRHLARKECLPASHLVDQGYTSVELLIQAQEQYGIDVVGPIPDDTSWQAQEGAYDIRQFAIDWTHQSVTCPQGKRSCSWTLAHTRSERPVVKVKFCLTDCSPCTQRPSCTRNHNEKRRTLTFLAPQPDFDAQQAARQRQQTTEFKQQHAARADVEGTISQAIFTLNARRSRYRGLSKTHCQHLATGTAINLGRVIAWLNDLQRSPTPKSHFARLAA